MNYECHKCKAKFSPTTEENINKSMVPGDRKSEWVFVCNECSGAGAMAIRKEESKPAGISIAEFMQAKIKIAKMQPVYDLAMKFIDAHMQHEKHMNNPDKNRATGRAAFEAERELIHRLTKQYLDETQSRD